MTNRIEQMAGIIAGSGMPWNEALQKAQAIVKALREPQDGEVSLAIERCGCVAMPVDEVAELTRFWQAMIDGI